MAHKGDDEFAAFAAVDATCSQPYRATVSTTVTTITALPAGRYWVRLDGVGFVLVRVGGNAALPTTGSAAAGTSYTLAAGEQYVHAATGDLTVIATGSGECWLQPISRPG